jgi:hypothetical protein
MYDSTLEILSLIMNTCNATYVPNIQDWWIGYYGKQVVANNVSQQEVVLGSVAAGVDIDPHVKLDVSVPVNTCTEKEDSEAITDMADAPLVSPVQGVVEQARATKRRRSRVKNKTDNVKRRRKTSHNRGRKRKNKKSKRAGKKTKRAGRSKKKSRRGSKKKRSSKHSKRGGSRKKKKTTGTRRIRKKKKQRDIFN